MAVSASYRLPGVYSVETTGPFVNAIAGGNAVPAFVGPAIGYIEAAQQATLTELDEVALNNTSVVSGSVKIVGRNTGTTYVNGVDFEESEDASTLVTSVKRKLQSLSLEKSTVSSRSVTFYTAEPMFSLLVDGSGNEIDGYIISGTVEILWEGETLEEGVDYEIDYYEGVFAAKAGGKLADPSANDTVLTISFDWTTAEPLALVGESAFTLQHQFISELGLGSGANAYTCNIVICPCTIDEEEYEYGDTPGAPDGYIENVDFVVDYQTGKITRTAESRIPSYSDTAKSYMYVEFAYCGIRSNEPVLITYDYAGENYTTPRIVSSYGEAAKYYGSAWDTETGEITSPLSLAAYIAFQNGMSYCYMCAVEASVTATEGGVVTSYTAAAWEEAFDSLTKVEGIDIVVPISADSAVWGFCLTHITTMKSNMDERVMIVGFDGTLTAISQSAMIGTAQGFSSEDVWLVVPATFKFRNPIRNIVEPIAGYYGAAAVAGYNSSVAQYVPLTRKAVSGFYGANERATKLEKQTMCANGLMYIDEVNGQLRILHGRTTSTASTIKSETNVTLAKYFIIKRLRSVFEEGFIGEIITDDTLLSVKASASSALARMRQNNYIYDYDGLTVEIDELVPTQVDITFQYIPVYGMNYIEISFAIDSGATA